MAYWSVAILLISISYLAYKHPPRTWLSQTPQEIRIENESSGKSPPPTEQNTADDEDAESEGTPKATATSNGTAIPTFSLSSNEDTAVEPPSPPKPKGPMFPAANSAQRASPSKTMPPPPKPASQSPSLMPPPARPTPRAPNTNTAASLRLPPTTGLLPNRGPPANSQQRASGGLLPNGTATSTPNPRNKVLLSPGHSPMDWAALTRSGNISGVSSFQRVRPSELKAMTGRKGKPAWSLWQGKVYNITPYLPFHPGGEAELMKAAGRDGTKLFLDVHPWVNWENMLSTCLVGVLVPEDYGESELEDMD